VGSWGAHAIVGLDPFVWCMLGLFGRLVVEFCEGTLDVAGHGDVDVFLLIVPVDGEPAVLGTGPVDGGGVCVADGIDEVVYVGLVEVFDAEVIDA
jgi:hypothetical protein